MALRIVKTVADEALAGAREPLVALQEIVALLDYVFQVELEYVDEALRDNPEVRRDLAERLGLPPGATAEHVHGAILARQQAIGRRVLGLDDGEQP
jgi:hypothetical protein